MGTTPKAVFILAITIWLSACASSDRTFSIDYQKNVFLKDGQPFQYISAEIHYFRIHPSLWQDRLYKVRAAGLNAVQVYVPWNFHEETPGIYNFNGDRDLPRFLRIAQEKELNVLLRIGPYVCAEWDFGGFPWWLIKDQENIALRTSNERYRLHVQRYFAVLLPILKPLLYKNGGPIIMLQIENEYGSVLCDHAYTSWLRDLVREALGKDVVLYTTDGYNDKMVSCGAVQGTFPTVDFGAPQTEESVKEHFAVQRSHSGGGPPVNSEFYTMWFSMWGDRTGFPQRIAPILDTMELMWRVNASFSLYMFHGGTNFGFWSGKEVDGPVITSYDYSAPISEEGGITPLYEAIRGWLSTKRNWPNRPLALPSNRTGVRIDNVLAVRLTDFMGLLNSSSGQCLRSQGKPLNLEAFDRDYGLLWHSAVLDRAGNLLEVPGLKDHAYVFLDGQFQGNLTVCDRTGCRLNLVLEAKAGQRLDILVESVGRLTFPLTKLDPRGILSAVLLDGRPVGQQWLQCGLDMDSLFTNAKRQFESGGMTSDESSSEAAPRQQPGPAIYVAKFNTEGLDWSRLHTFFDSRGWGHGLLLLNRFNLGRYWPLLGPQMTLFVPGALMHNENFAMVLELTGRQEPAKLVKFVDRPIYGFDEHSADDGTSSTGQPPVSGFERKNEIALAFRRGVRRRAAGHHHHSSGRRMSFFSHF